MVQHFKPARCSWQGALVRRLIALTVRLLGGDVLAIGRKRVRRPDPRWRPPASFRLERVALPGPAMAEYLLPPDCRRPDICIMQIHGGGYVIPYNTVHQRRSLRLARLAGSLPVLSLDYRVAPEHPYPAALEDGLAALAWLQREQGLSPQSVIAIGDSAGGGLALALAQALRDRGLGQFRALVLLSPWTDLTCRNESHSSRARFDPFFRRTSGKTNQARAWQASQFYAGTRDLTEPCLSPIFGDFTGLPPMLIHVGECEVLYDDAVNTAAKAREAGVSAQLTVWPGLFHVFHLADALIPEARRAWQEIDRFLQRIIDAPK
jgi:acetyl esterase/lipase